MTLSVALQIVDADLRIYNTGAKTIANYNEALPRPRASDIIGQEVPTNDIGFRSILRRDNVQFHNRAIG